MMILITVYLQLERSGKEKVPWGRVSIPGSANCTGSRRVPFWMRLRTCRRRFAFHPVLLLITFGGISKTLACVTTCKVALAQTVDYQSQAHNIHSNCPLHPDHSLLGVYDEDRDLSDMCVIYIMDSGPPLFDGMKNDRHQKPCTSDRHPVSPLLSAISHTMKMKSTPQQRQAVCTAAKNLSN
jgi:hypothetical protein